MKFLMMLIAVVAMLTFGGVADAQIGGPPVSPDEVWFPVVVTGGQFFTPQEAWSDAIAAWTPQAQAVAAGIGPPLIVIDISSTLLGPYEYNVTLVWSEAADGLVEAYTCTVNGGVRAAIIGPAP